MQLVRRDVAEFRRDPVNAYVAGDGWLYFALEQSVFGYLLWGSPPVHAVRELVQLMELELDRPPHTALADVSRVELFGREAFAVLTGYVLEHGRALSRIVTAASVVRPSGFNGALASGFFAIVPAPFPVTVADSAVEALARLAYRAPREGALALEDACRSASGTPILVSDLRSYLAQNLPTATIDQAAVRLGVSTRTLQRGMTQAGTSFVVELQAARVQAAERLLVETDEPVTAIAIEVGCASSQQFSTLFRKYRGETPTAFRARRGRS